MGEPSHTLSSPWEGSGLVLLCLPWDSAASSKSSCPWGSQESRLRFVGRRFSFCRPHHHYCAQRSGGWRKKSPPPACPAELPRETRPSLPSGSACSPLPTPCAPTSRAPHPGDGQVKAIYLSTCGAARCPVSHSGFLHLPRALSQCRSIPRLQVAGARAEQSRAPLQDARVSAEKTRS